MFEGRLKSVKDGKVEIEIKQSQLYSTSGFPIHATVKVNQAIRPHALAFSSIVFSYYFRVRSLTDSKTRELLEMKGTPNKSLDTSGGSVFRKLILPARLE